MPKRILIGLLFISISGIAAEPLSPSPSPSGVPGGLSVRGGAAPGCRPLVQACRRAITPTGVPNSNRAAIRACMQSVLKGIPVTGVTATAEQVAACKKDSEGKKERRLERLKKRSQLPAGVGPSGVPRR